MKEVDGQGVDAGGEDQRADCGEVQRGNNDEFVSCVGCPLSSTYSAQYACQSPPPVLTKIQNIGMTLDINLQLLITITGVH